MNQEIEEKTSNIFGSLFGAYSQKLFDDSVNLFFMRHKKWGIDLELFKNKTCLDGGCGGGRFLVALSKLGAKEVRGIDISQEAVDLANQRIKERGIVQARAQKASVLEIPFADNYFDYVVSSGVVHHTPDPHKAFKELVRVLKPGGKFFFSVYGKGGLRWLANDFFRYTFCKIIPFKTMEKIWQAFGVPANKRYNMLDNLYVPFCFRFSEKEIRSWLVDSGFENIQRVKFERYDYEALLSRILYGNGWIQIYADKK